MFKSFTSGVSSWLGAEKPDDDNVDIPVATPKDDKSTPTETASNETESAQKENQNKEVKEGEKEPQPQITPKGEDESEDSVAEIQAQLEEVSTKAIGAAKEWGTWLVDVGKTATTEVVKQAKKVKDTVEEKTIIGQFQKEQNKFVAEKKEQKSSEAAVAPWVGYNEEESLKKQILALSQDKRNFLRNPPSGVQYNFEFNNMLPIAMATLQEDENLQKMRFELVPKQCSEEGFWRNYFYRVSLIKQTADLNSFAQDKGSTGESSNRSTPEPTKSDTEITQEPSKAKARLTSENEPEDLTTGGDQEFISDSYQEDGLDDEDLKKEMEELRKSEGNKAEEANKTKGMYVLYFPDGEEKRDDKRDENIPEWERELQAELQEYEVVDDGNNLDDADLEKEILQQLEQESSEQK